VHNGPAPVLGCGPDHPTGGRPWRRAGQTVGRHAGEIHPFDGRQLPIGHPDRVLGRLDPVWARDPGQDAHEVTPRVRTGYLPALVEPDLHGLPVRKRQRYLGRKESGRPASTVRAGHLPRPGSQLPRRGAQRCPLPGPGLPPVGVPPHLHRQLQQTPPQDCRPLPVGRVSKPPVRPFPGALRGDQILGKSRATHTSYCIMCSIYSASLQLEGGCRSGGVSSGVALGEGWRLRAG